MKNYNQKQFLLSSVISVGVICSTNVMSQPITKNETTIRTENEDYNFEKTVIASGAFSKFLKAKSHIFKQTKVLVGYDQLNLQKIHSV